MTDVVVLDSIEKLRERGLHQILFRNAGVGFQFYEPPEGFEIEINRSWKKYLIIRQYYPTLEEALSAELARLE